MSALPRLAAPAVEVSAWRAAWETFRSGLPGNEPAWLGMRRAAAMARFEEVGFPTTRDEDWRHTSVAPISRTAFRLADDRDAAGVREEDLAAVVFGHAFDGHQIVFVDGRYAPELSDAPQRDGVVIRSLREVLDDQPQLVEAWLGRHAEPTASAFAALNTAFLSDGAFVSVPAGTVLREPIHVVFYSTRGGSLEPTVSHPRVFALVGRGAQATLVESYGGTEDEAYFTNAVSEVVLEDGAVVEHYRIQRESERAFHVGTLGLFQGRASNLTSHAVVMGAELSRLDVRQLFGGEGGECVLNGLFMVAGTQHADIHTWVDHAQPHCTTRELYKGVLDGKSRGVFVGKVFVRPGAVKTDAQQTNKNLLLSKEALVDSLPQLEILNDDVKCKHGSTTGQLDALALFYLRSRGVGEAAARSLLTYAFASDVVMRMKVEALRTGLAEHLERRLPAALDVKEALA
jgi:Fe-S cluster assembly protein SufD